MLPGKMTSHSQQGLLPFTPTIRPRRSPTRLVVAVLIVLGLLSSFASAHLRVVVSIEPYREPLERLLGDAGTVDVLLPPGASPHAFDPTPRDVVRLTEADLIVVNGGLDGWLLELNEALAAPRPVHRVLDTLDLDAVDHLDHDDDHSDEEHDADPHAHEGGVNPHVWLDPRLMDAAVAALAERLADLDAPRADAIRRAADAYRSELAQLDAEIATRLAPFAGAPFVPFHDGWPYFAERYALDLVAEIEPFPGREPSARALAETIDLLRRTRARAVFTEVQLGDRSARVLADEAGVAVGVLDPIGGVEGRDGYLEMMAYNARVIADVLGGEPTDPQ